MSHELIRAWERTVRIRPDEPAVTQASDRKSRTFRELDEGSTRWRAAHASAPALAGRSVVFSEPNGIRWFEIFIGLMKAGAVAVPLDAAEPAAAQRGQAEALRSAGWWDGSRLVPLAASRRHREAAPCLIKLTSGTTGRPRPLAFSAAELLADARQITAAMAIRPGDLNYALIPLGHSYGLGNLTVPLIAQGVPLVCGTAPLPHAIAGDFRQWRPTVFPGVPAVWRALALAGVEPESLGSLRLAISAGAPLDPGVARQFAERLGRRLHNLYGSSETGGIAFDRSGEATLAGGVGRAIRGVRVTRLAGERVRVCSAAVFTKANRLKCGGFGCWTPSDRVLLDGRGNLRLAGRRGTLVKIAGRRVNLAEVEARLLRIAGVREAWVAAGPGDPSVLGAALATNRRADELRAELLKDTASWKIPKRWVLLPLLPRTARGKVDARLLSARLFRQDRLDFNQKV